LSRLQGKKTYLTSFAKVGGELSTIQHTLISQMWSVAGFTVMHYNEMQ